MAKATYEQRGQIIDLVASAAVESGDIIQTGNLVGVVQGDAAIGETYGLDISGAHFFPKSGTAGPVFAIGDYVYWDVVNEVAIHKGAGTAGNLFLGVCVAAAGASATQVLVRIEPELPHVFAGRLREDLSIASGSYTVDLEDTGKVLNVTGSATNVITLPAVVVGYDIVFRAAADGVRIAISPNASDLIFGANDAGVDNKDLILAAATAKAGDYARLVYGSAAGWLLVESRGVWTKEA